MKKLTIVVLLLAVLTLSFVAGILTSPVQAGNCYRFCDTNTCLLMKCCAGNCVSMGSCPPQYCPR